MHNRNQQISPAGAWAFGLCFAGFATVFIGLVAQDVLRQYVRLRTFVAVPAAIVRTSIGTHVSKKSSNQTYDAYVVFTYTVDDRQYSSTNKYPIDRGFGSMERAQDLIARFPVDRQVTAWRSPGAPGDAFLIREAAFTPYAGMLFAMIHFTAGLAIALFAGKNRNLSPATISARLLAITAIWNSVGIAVAGHYALAGGVFTGTALVALGIYFTAGAGMLAWWWKRQSAPGI